MLELTLVSRESERIASSDLTFLLVHTAANLLRESEQELCNPEILKDESSVNGIIYKYIGWDNRLTTDAQAKLLYGFVKTFISTKKEDIGIIFEKPARQLVADALEAYKLHCTHNSEGINWTEYNKEFINYLPN